MRCTTTLFILAVVLGQMRPTSTLGVDVPRFAVFQATFEHYGTYDNPYTETQATTTLEGPDGGKYTVPLFWDGDRIWRFRFSPDREGLWRWQTMSQDKGLDSRSGSFTVVASDLKGGLRPMHQAPHHFEHQDGTPFWFFGDTAWALYTDSEEEKHNRRTALEYVHARGEQGFNVLHSMLLSEAGWGNQGGPPFDDIATLTAFSLPIPCCPVALPAANGYHRRRHAPL